MNVFRLCSIAVWALYKLKSFSLWEDPKKKSGPKLNKCLYAFYEDYFNAALAILVISTFRND